MIECFSTRLAKRADSSEPDDDGEDADCRSELQRLERKLVDLELSLLTANEHGDLLQDHLYRLSNALAAEVQERQAAELRLQRAIEAITREKTDLEIILQILIEQGDYSAAEGAQARIDGLTGIANRRRLDEHLPHEWERHRKGCMPLSFMLCDVDYFKAFNDHHGHQAGDDCLRAIGELVSGTVRGSDLVARYGGEEFAVVLPETERDKAILIAERIRAAVAGARYIHAASPISAHVSVSIGIGCARPSDAASEGAMHLIREADRHLYLAKRNGRNRVEPISH